MTYFPYVLEIMLHGSGIHIVLLCANDYMAIKPPDDIYLWTWHNIAQRDSRKLICYPVLSIDDPKISWDPYDHFLKIWSEALDFFFQTYESLHFETICNQIIKSEAAVTMFESCEFVGPALIFNEIRETKKICFAKSKRRKTYNGENISILNS